MDEPARGMVVMGPSGQLGTVDEVIYENTGDPARVMVRRENGQEMILQPGAYHVQDGILRLGGGSLVDSAGTAFATQQIETTAASSSVNAGQYRTQELGAAGSVETIDVKPGVGTVIPVIREEVNVTRRQVERGGVRVHKRVEEREEVVEQPTFREKVTVERVPIGQVVDREVGPWQDGDTLIIPVLEEMLVVEKRLVVKEEIRITKRRIDETEQARVVLRQEYVDIENIEDSSTMA